MNAPCRAAEPAPDAELLEFIAQWGESAALIDQAEDPAADDSAPSPPGQADDETD